MTQLTSTSPKSFVQFLQAMVPAANNFKYMTPLYCFLFTAGLLAWRWRKNSFGVLEFGLANLLVYALVLYFEAFRIIEGGQFETALQVEKILYFFLIETVAVWALSKHKLRLVVTIFLMGILSLSVGYTVARYCKRSPVLKNKSEEAAMRLTIDRARGVKTSSQQAQELESVVTTVDNYTDAQDKIFAYPDMGTYYFFCKRGFVGRFPVGTLAWMRPDWQEELMQSLNTQMPKVIILQTNLTDNFTKVYFKRAANLEYYNDIVHFVDLHYDLIVTTPLSGIYLRKK